MDKAQIKMFENIGVLVVFFFLLVIGSTFYFRMQQSGFEQERVQQAQLKSLAAAQRATFLPELECAFLGVPREGCLDKVKLTVFADLLGRDQRVAERAFALFGFATITVREAYPAEGGAIPLYSRVPDEYRSALRTMIPVLLYGPVDGTYAFGVMEVTTYAER